MFVLAGTKIKMTRTRPILCNARSFHDVIRECEGYILHADKRRGNNEARNEFSLYAIQ